MGKVKIKKSDVWIDMTPMSDVMTLLLTFFMLTSTFVKNEPVKVNTPGSVSEIKVPENGVLTILVSPEKDAAGRPTGEGQVFMSIDNTDQLGSTLSSMTSNFGVELTPKMQETFKSEGTFGVPMGDLKTYLSLNASKRPEYLQKKGIPLDSINGGMSEFQQWVQAARTVNEEIKIALKADASTPYKTVKRVMNELQDMDESHYYMIIADFDDMKRVAREVPEQAKKLADAFWPGPLTMIVWKSDAVPEATTGGMQTVAVRMPNHPVALELIRRSGCLIAAPSANTSGRPSPTEAQHVAEDLSGKIAMILDGGPVGIGIESTIIDLTEEKPMILRPGYITPEMLSEVLQEEVVIDPGIIAADDTRKPKAPGMKYKHYAPKAEMIIVDGAQDAVIHKINELTAAKRAEGKKVAVIATDETKDRYDAQVILSMGKRADEDAIAQHLYKILRECDELDVGEIYSECFQTPRIGQAIMNRLLKAAGHTVIHV